MLSKIIIKRILKISLIMIIGDVFSLKNIFKIFLGILTNFRKHFKKSEKSLIVPLIKTFDR